MTRSTPTPTPQLADLELAQACLACGGDLSVRIRPGTVRSVCRGCGGWSSPLLAQEDDGLRLHQAAGGRA